MAIVTRSLARNMKAKESNNLVSLLPPEIIEWEILTRLPVKSLLRFKSACKSWNLLISSNHNFIKSQLELNPNKDSLILDQLDCNCHYKNSFMSKYPMLIGCINGLVCLCLFQYYNDFKVIEIAIWNPATNRCLEIPPLPGVRGHDLLLGFGFDSIANDFKVMQGVLIEKQPLAVDVYSCKAACWKKIAPSNILYSGEICQQREPTIVNGTPLWLNRKNQNAKISLNVVSFDVRHEVFRLLPSFSVTDHTKSKTCVLMNFQDSFAIIVYDRRMYFVEPIDVYIFNQRCSTWNKISIGPFICKELYIKLNEIFIGEYTIQETMIEVHRLLPCSRNGDIIFVDGHGSRLYGVNPETHTIKVLKEGSYEEHIFKCFNYSESLIFVEGMKSISGKKDKGRFKFLLRERLELARSYEYI